MRPPFTAGSVVSAGLGLGGSILNALQHLQLTLFQPEYHISLLRQLVGVSNDHHTLVHLVGALFKNFRDVLGGVLVQIAGRLVRKNHRGLACQGTGDGHTLLLAAGEF